VRRYLGTSRRTYVRDRPWPARARLNEAAHAPPTDSAWQPAHVLWLHAAAGCWAGTEAPEGLPLVRHARILELRPPALAALRIDAHPQRAVEEQEHARVIGQPEGERGGPR